MSSNIVEDIVYGRSLSAKESYDLMQAMVVGDMPLAQVAALLTTYAIRGMSLDALDGFSSALLDLAKRIDLGHKDIIDLCGTGGDGKSSFNISTTSAFVLAGAGYKVAKHGNVAVSSKCGSSNVLAELGIPLIDDVDRLKRALEENNLCFLHAPLFHPGLKNLAPLRKELGFRTIFNALGPLINPAQIDFQYNGVYSFELQRLYGYLLQRRQRKFAVVHSLDGFDEVSLTAPVRIVANCGSCELEPDLFLRGAGRSEQSLTKELSASIRLDQIAAPHSIRENAVLVESILSRSASSEQTQVVIANAAVAIWCFNGMKASLSECIAKATESIDSGAALKILNRSREIS